MKRTARTSSRRRRYENLCRTYKTRLSDGRAASWRQSIPPVGRQYSFVSKGMLVWVNTSGVGAQKISRLTEGRLIGGGCMPNDNTGGALTSANKKTVDGAIKVCAIWRVRRACRRGRGQRCGNIDPDGGQQRDDETCCRLERIGDRNGVAS